VAYPKPLFIQTIKIPMHQSNQPAMSIPFLKNQAARVQYPTASDQSDNAGSQRKIPSDQTIKRMMIKTQESERNKLGRELHDNINQILAAVKLQLEYSLDNYENEKATVERCKTNIEEAIREIRNLSHRLVLPRFAETTLEAELKKTIENICQQFSVCLNIDNLKEYLLPDGIKETLYRIIQEQLGNIIKHAKAKQITIQLHNNNNAVYLFIKDNGIGFNPNESRNGVGINNILSRVESYNGSARFISKPGNGCRLDVIIPLR
jgi:two-component system sensor histidine kinase UhpB